MQAKIIVIVSVLLVTAVVGGLGASALSSMIADQNKINQNSDSRTSDESIPDSFTDSISKLFFSSAT